MNSSLTTHGALTEPSLIDHIGKGREGEGSGKGRFKCVSHASTVPTNRPGIACRYAESRCGR